MPAILGIDPGNEGALAWFEPRPTPSERGRYALRIHDMPVIEVVKGGKKRKEISEHALVGLIRADKPTHAFVELVNSTPNDGHAGAFTFGMGFGFLRATLAALEIPFTLVIPNTWKKGVGIKSGAAKAESCKKAAQMFPAQASQFFGPRGGAHDGRADAALIAFHGWMTRRNMIDAMF